MKFVCERTLLSNAISGVSKANSGRAPIPVLEGLLLKAEGFSLTLTGYNMELAIKTTIECNVLVAGETVLNAKLLGDIVSRMNSSQVSIELTDHGVAIIKGGVAQFEMAAMLPNDYPELPVPDASHTCKMPVATMREMIEQTIFAVSTDDKKPAHTGVLFVIQPDALTFVCLDGYRLAIVKRDIPCTKDIRVIVPAKTMNELNKLMGEDGEQMVDVFANRHFAVFHVNGYQIMSRLISGEFLNYQRVIPDGFKTRAVVDTKSFIDTIERASLIITERLKNPLRVQFTDGMVVVRCQTNLGKVQDEFEADIQGDPVEIGFNNRYLLDALRNSKAEQVVLEMNGPLAPVKMLSVEGEDFTYLVLPVRFKND